MSLFAKRKSVKTPAPVNEEELIASAAKDGKYEKIIEQGNITVIDVLRPSPVNTKPTDYVHVDGTYIATLLVITFPYERPSGWLDDIINYGEGVEVAIYYEPLDKQKTVKDITHMIGMTSVKRKNTSDNQSDVEVIDTALGHAKYMRQKMNVDREDPYYLYILISVYAECEEKLKERLTSVEAFLGGQDIMTRRADFRHSDAFKACLPLHQLHDLLKKPTRRNALTTGLASTYPFVASEFSDENGVFIGQNEHNKSLVIVDFFNNAVYKNSNMVVLGTSGAGKTFLLQLLAMRLRAQGIQVMIIAPLKGHEFRNACEAVGGTFINIAPGSTDYINIFDIREGTLDQEFEDEECTVVKKSSNDSILLSKIQRLLIYFSLVFRDMTDLEQQYLDKKLIELYAGKGITFDNSSLYSDELGDTFTTRRKFKPMPLKEEFHSLLAADPKTQRLADLLLMYVDGSLQSFNRPTNVDLNNKYIVADVSNLNKKLLPIGMFLAMETFWDKIKEDRTAKKVVIVDEAWKLIGGGGNEDTANFVLEIFKIIRGYGGSAVAATQDVSDFYALEGGKYSKGIINNSKLKFVLQLEEDEAKTLEKVLKLSEEEIAKITKFERGHGLFYAGDNHVAIEFKASDEEKELITTDRAELEAIKKRKIQMKEEQAS